MFKLRSVTDLSTSPLILLLLGAWGDALQKSPQGSLSANRIRIKFGSK